MAMQDLRETIKSAEEKRVAISHFNISNLEALWGIFKAARSLSVPVIIGLSEGERDFTGVRQAVALVKSIREEYDYPIFLNADHTYSFERVKEAVDSGFDAVIFDGTKLPLEENIKFTKECVEYAKASGKNILVEGELGYIGSSSKILDEIPEGSQITPETMTKPEEISRFAKETGIDLVAPAVGNIHGIMRSGHNPALHIERIKELRQASGIPLVLHGGSGISDGDFRKAIEAGVSVVHISSEIRLAYRNALKLSLQENPDEIAPYKFLKPAEKAVEDAVLKRLKLFNNL